MNKTKYIKIRVSEAELSKLKQLSEKNGLTVSAYIRYLVARDNKTLTKHNKRCKIKVKICGVNL